jgi:hypothetical protein
VDARPVTSLQVGSRQAFLGVLRVKEEGKPLDLRAEPALQPLGPGEADVAERSRVVAPDDDGQHVHGSRLREGRTESRSPGFLTTVSAADLAPGDEAQAEEMAALHEESGTRAPRELFEGRPNVLRADGSVRERRRGGRRDRSRVGPGIVHWRSSRALLRGRSARAVRWGRVGVNVLQRARSRLHEPAPDGRSWVRSRHAPLVASDAGPRAARRIRRRDRARPA